MTSLPCRPVPFKFQLGDLTLFSVSALLQMYSKRLIDETQPTAAPMPPAEKLMPGSQGFAIRGLPVCAEIPAISRTGDFLRYVPLIYQHCYIDLQLSFAEYESSFSAKTRSTINRKIRKFRRNCDDTINWKTYSQPDEMREFFRLASLVSEKTYQERLLDAGIPRSETFIRDAEMLSADQRVRAYILFDREKPVSYLYCPVIDEVLIYAYLGYDPDYRGLSVGTVLQWLAIEQLFNEGNFRYFDFTEGESAHKQLFSTHQRRCANVFFLKKNLRNLALIYSHRTMDSFSSWLGISLDRLGLKNKIKRILRFGQ